MNFLDTIKTMLSRFILVILFSTIAAIAQIPPIEPGVSLNLAKWRAARYSNVRYRLNLTLEKMSPVLKGMIEIRVNVSEPPASRGDGTATKLAETRPEVSVPIVLDWRKIKGFEESSTISNVTVNGKPVTVSASPPANAGGSDFNEHLIFRDGVVAGENVVKLDFTSPILTSGSAITRYIDKEDGSEYIYSLFVPSDASTAFPVFDQPDLKARFEVDMNVPVTWSAVSNGGLAYWNQLVDPTRSSDDWRIVFAFNETMPISSYVFAFAAGPFETFEERSRKHVIDELVLERGIKVVPHNYYDYPSELGISEIEVRKRMRAIYVRKSQAAKFKPHAAEVFRLNREAIKYFEQYFDYKFPWPKYDLVLIPEFPFGGMEHAGATFLRESAIIFPQEPTKNDYISRATLIFHETAHQWFGDTVTMRWFDDLWLKEGFATFMAYKAMEKIMPESNAWKIFYERVKQAAYRTDSTKGTTPIYQEINNLSSAKSAYGAIVYNKAPAFLRQAEFYLGEDKFQTAVRAFLKKNEFGNAGWEDLVREFEGASTKYLDEWANLWVMQRGMPIVNISESTADMKWFVRNNLKKDFTFPKYSQAFDSRYRGVPDGHGSWTMKAKFLVEYKSGKRIIEGYDVGGAFGFWDDEKIDYHYILQNYQDYGYGIFLLDDKSRDYVLKNIQNEKDPFLRSMMWGSLWDSVREGELDPREYVELVVKNLNVESDESTIATLLGRTGTALNYYLNEGQGVSSPTVREGATGRQDAPSQTVGLQMRVETLLIEWMRNAETLGQRITFYRAFLNIALTKNARGVLKQLLTDGVSSPAVREGAPLNPRASLLTRGLLTLRTKDRFDIVTRLLILGDEEAPKLLADLEKTETGDDARRYAYAARAGIATADNKAKYWQDFTANREISESWIEEAFGPFNSIRHADFTLPYLEQALKELPNQKRNRKIFFINGWLGAFIGGQRSKAALEIINKFLESNSSLDNDLRLKILENADIIERAVKIRSKFAD